MNSDALQLTTLEESPLWLEVFGSKLIISFSLRSFVSCHTQTQNLLKKFSASSMGTMRPCSIQIVIEFKVTAAGQIFYFFTFADRYSSA